MHQPPDVPNYGNPRRGPRLSTRYVPGDRAHLHPRRLGCTVELDDEWTAVTDDGSWAAHWENTVAITEDGLWVLTELDGGRAELAARGVTINEL